MKAPVLVTIVVFLHAMVIGTLVFVQGCGTPQPKVEPPPAPVMPAPAAPEKSSMLPPGVTDGAVKSGAVLVTSTLMVMLLVNVRE